MPASFAAAAMPSTRTAWEGRDSADAAAAGQSTIPAETAAVCTDGQPADDPLAEVLEVLEQRHRHAAQLALPTRERRADLLGEGELGEQGGQRLRLVQCRDDD